MKTTAEINLIHSKRKADIEIIGGNDTSLITTIPQLEEEYIRLFNEEEFTIQFTEDGVFIELEVTYQGAKEISENLYYQFKIENIKTFEDTRKQKRKNVELRAVFFREKGIGFAEVIDISQNGMRIKTYDKIEEEEVSILIDIKGRKLEKKAKVIWKKEKDEVYTYGLIME